MTRPRRRAAGCSAPGGIAAIGTAGALALTNGASAARSVRTALERLDPRQVDEQQEGAARRRPDVPAAPVHRPEDEEAVRLHGRAHRADDVRPRRHPGLGADAVRAALRGARGGQVRHGRHRRDDPARAARCRAYFAGVPVFYESNVVLVKKTLEGARPERPAPDREVRRAPGQLAAGERPGDLPEGVTFKAFASESDAATRGRRSAAPTRRSSASSRPARSSARTRPCARSAARRSSSTRTRYLMPHGRREALPLGHELAALPVDAPDDGGPLEEVGRARRREKYHLETSVVGHERRAGLRHVLSPDRRSGRGGEVRLSPPGALAHGRMLIAYTYQLAAGPGSLARAARRRLGRRLDHADLVRARVHPRHRDRAPAHLRAPRCFRWPAFVYVQLVRGVPLLVFLYWVYFGRRDRCSGSTSPRRRRRSSRSP